MAKAELKTKANELSVGDFIAALPDPAKREDAERLDALHRRVTGQQPQMWGPGIIGYGSYHYKYDSGREGVMCRAGFSPRKAAMTIYSMGNFAERGDEAAALFAQLGKHTTGKGCLYIKRLADVDMAVLERLIGLSWDAMNAKYPD